MQYERDKRTNERVEQTQISSTLTVFFFLIDFDFITNQKQKKKSNYESLLVVDRLLVAFCGDAAVAPRAAHSPHECL
jgi:hypothetical protein